MTDWHSKVPEQTLLLTRLGATDADLAKFFNVEERTIHNWKHEHPAFLEAIIEGKDVSDAKVAKSLYQRALGYSHEAVKIFADPKTGTELQVPYTEHYPPDTTAAIFWLKNRQSAKWRDRVEHTGAEGGPMVVRWETGEQKPE